MRREERLYGPATLAQLGRAQEETRQQKERGWLREPCRWKEAEFKVGDQVMRAFVPTKAEERRKAAQTNVPVRGVGSVLQDVPPWAMGMSYYPMANPRVPLVACYATEQRAATITVLPAMEAGNAVLNAYVATPPKAPEGAPRRLVRSR
jgi:hypothetical protein